MRRRIGAWLALLALLSPAAPGAQAQALDRAMASVVSVLPDWPPQATPREAPEGSGVALLDGRLVVTALHVVDKALAIRVRTFDGEIVPARLAARDPATDIAILTIEQAVAPIRVAQEEPRVGAPVCAIGNAFGLGLTVTCGVVSALHQSGVGFNAIEDFVQTDAAVNPGASGGALVTRDGELVGMLSAIFTKEADANIGVNFAVAAGLVEHVARQLMEHGKVRRVRSGLRLMPEPAKGATGRLAARVASVRPGSPAERAGVKTGDLVVAAAGRPVRKPADFVGATACITAPAEVEIVLRRDGANVTLVLEYREAP